MDKNNIVKKYPYYGGQIIWQSGKCIHSGNCVKNLPGAFKPKEKPWITTDGFSAEEIEAAVAKCPSGALSIEK